MIILQYLIPNVDTEWSPDTLNNHQFELHQITAINLS